MGRLRGDSRADRRGIRHAVRRDRRPLAAAAAGSPSLVAVPVGVGSLAQAAVAHYRGRRPAATASGAAPAALLSVEPEVAACVLTSLRAGRPTSVETGVTAMTGLNCGTPSALAWPVLRDGLDAAVASATPTARRPCATSRSWASRPVRVAPPPSRGRARPHRSGQRRTPGGAGRRSRLDGRTDQHRGGGRQPRTSLRGPGLTARERRFPVDAGCRKKNQFRKDAGQRVVGVYTNADCPYAGQAPRDRVTAPELPERPYGHRPPNAHIRKSTIRLALTLRTGKTPHRSHQPQPAKESSPCVAPSGR